ncbi:MAG: MBL fold metallo-hydrolase [Ignavibacteriales bacterium UTCHB3]|nr:MAG: MBL fold metallo-hydrolase [Ignavibacteriales bacterium UTCHB3]
MIKTEYPIYWEKEDFSIKIFCSIPAIATGILLRAGGAKVVIDPGDGILRDLNEELTPEEILSITDVFITHGHHDHVGGVWSLLTYLRIMRKRTTLNIWFPEGCPEIESIYNAFRTVYSNSIPYPIILRTIMDYKPFTPRGLTVKPFPVIHAEKIEDGPETRLVPSLGFKFTWQGKKICYGGDTAYCEELVKQAKGADLAIIEAGEDEDSVPGMHMTQEEAEKIGRTAKEFFLVHVPQ